jgi:competence ComEA-like helix-hairpin-helix protein
MNHVESASYTEPYRQYTREGANFEQVIASAIASARSRVDVAVQEFRLPGIAQALAERQRAGVQVRVVLENTYSRPYSQFSEAEVRTLPARERDRYQEARRLIDINQDEQLSQAEINQRDALVILDQAQIPRIDDTADGSAGSNLMHHKFLVVDGHTLIVTSANFTPSDVHGDFKSQHSRGNANNLLQIESAELAAIFTEEFNYLWGDGPDGQPNSQFGVKKPFRPARTLRIGSTQVEVQFSPSPSAIAWDQSSNGLISRTLVNAKKTLQMALFVFSDQQLVNRLEPVHRAGIELQALIDPGFAYRSYSEALDMMGVALQDDCQIEADNRLWQPAISTVGVPRMTPGDLLHHKFGIVDRQTVITGSHNWTEAANRGNDETVLVIHNPTVAAHYVQEFERLYGNAILGVPVAIDKKAKAQNSQCEVAQAPELEHHLSPVTSPQGTPHTAVLTTNGKAQAVQSSHSRKPRSRQTPPAPLPPANQPEPRVNLNTATLAELEALPGIGPGLAKRIVLARQKRPFHSLQDLDQVSGVGPKLLEKLRDRVSW